MMRHAFAEGWLLLRQRVGVSVVLALALAVPISFAGVGLTLAEVAGARGRAVATEDGRSGVAPPTTR